MNNAINNLRHIVAALIFIANFMPLTRKPELINNQTPWRKKFIASVRLKQFLHSKQSRCLIHIKHDTQTFAQG